MVQWVFESGVFPTEQVQAFCKAAVGLGHWAVPWRDEWREGLLSLPPPAHTPSLPFIFRGSLGNAVWGLCRFLQPDLGSAHLFRRLHIYSVGP